MHEKNDNLQNLSALQQQRDFEKRAWQYECDQLTSKLRFFDRHLPECLRVCRQRIVDKYSVLHNDTQVDRLRLGLLPSAKSNPGSLFCKDRNVKRFSPKKYVENQKKKHDSVNSNFPKPHVSPVWSKHQTIDHISLKPANRTSPCTNEKSPRERRLKSAPVTPTSSSSHRPGHTQNPHSNTSNSRNASLHRSPRPPASPFSPRIVEKDGSTHVSMPPPKSRQFRSQREIYTPEQVIESRPGLPGSDAYFRDLLHVYGGCGLLNEWLKHQQPQVEQSNWPFWMEQLEKNDFRIRPIDHRESDKFLWPYPRPSSAFDVVDVKDMEDISYKASFEELYSRYLYYIYCKSGAKGRVSASELRKPSKWNIDTVKEFKESRIDVNGKPLQTFASLSLSPRAFYSHPIHQSD